MIRSSLPKQSMHTREFSPSQRPHGMAQVGGELTDLLIVLRSKAAVNAFCGTVAAGVGGAASFAAGPLGRQADAGLTLGRGGAALCYSYSISRGAFAGNLNLSYVHGNSFQCLYSGAAVVCYFSSVLLLLMSSHHEHECNTSQCFSAGVSVEGTVISSREAANLSFYGRPHSAHALLTGSATPPPVAASALYQVCRKVLR